MADDLLSFVQALDAADEEAVGGHFESGGKRKKQQLKPILVQSTKLSLDDLEVDDGEAVASTKKRRRPRPLQVPLAPVLQQKVEQAVAYEETRKDVTESWAGIINANRKKEFLTFPMNPSVPNQPNLSESIEDFEPQNDFEKAYFKAMREAGLMKARSESPDDHSFDTHFPLNVEQIKKDAEADVINRAKLRSETFFKDKKAAHQAKIKSKKYRKMLSREREREALKAEMNRDPKERLLEASNPEKKRRIREAAELERARERLTLKTRKANQWATDMLMHKHSGDWQAKQAILDQVRNKDRLRQEILGKAEDISSSESSDDSDLSEVEGEPEEAGEEMREITGDVSEDEEAPIGRRVFGSVGKPSKQGNEAFHNEDIDGEDAASEENSTILSKVLSQATARRSKDAVKWFDEGVPAEFAREKEAEMSCEAPKIVDLTLPGWGSWTGPQYENMPPKPPRVYKIEAGIKPDSRKDRSLAHVIITEKRPKSTFKYQTDRVPFPFTTQEQYERHLEDGLGREWNTRGASRMKTKARIQVKAGQIINPIKRSSAQ